MSRPEYFEPYYAIKIGGVQLTDAELARLAGSIKVELSAEDDDQASFTFDETVDYHFQSHYLENMDVEIEYGHLRGERAVYRGEISAVKPKFPASGVPTMAYECSSKAKQGHERQQSRTFKEKKYSDVAAQVAAEHDWATDITPTTEVIGQITQAGETDMQFLRRLAGKLNYIAKVTGATLYFGPQPIAGEESETLDYRTGNYLCKSFDPKFETQDKGKRVSGSNINEKEQQQITSKAWGTGDKLGLKGGAELVATSNAGDGSGWWNVTGAASAAIEAIAATSPSAPALWVTQGTDNPTVPVAHRPDEPTANPKPAPVNRAEAKVGLEKGRDKTGVESATRDAAEEPTGQTPALEGGLGKSTMHYLRDTGEGGGLPDNAEEMEKAVTAKQRKNEKVVGGAATLSVCKPTLKGNDKVVIQGVGPRFSGTYFVEKATHTIGGSGALTKLDLSRNALGDDTKGTGRRSSGTAGAGTQAKQELTKRQWETRDKLGLTNR